LELATRQHLQLGYHLQDKMLNRPCTPTKPLIPAVPKKISNDDNNNIAADTGTFELTVKPYVPYASQPGDTASNILDCMSNRRNSIQRQRLLYGIEQST
jgi:nitrate reductase (NAD(P)H)